MKNLLLASNGWSTYVILGAVVVLFIVMMMFQTRKRKRSADEYRGMLDTLRPGTRVKTVGGVIGRIREIREEAPGFKTVLLESGDPKNPSLVLYDIQAIYGVVDDAALAAKKAELDAFTGAPQSVPQITPAQPADVPAHPAANDGVQPTENVFETKKPRAKSKQTTPTNN